MKGVVQVYNRNRVCFVDSKDHSLVTPSQLPSEDDVSGLTFQCLDSRYLTQSPGDKNIDHTNLHHFQNMEYTFPGSATYNVVQKF